MASRENCAFSRTKGLRSDSRRRCRDPRVRLGTVRMEFDYADYFGTAPNTGYETLLYDTMTGDSTHFHRVDIVEAGWKVVDPILREWDDERRHLAHVSLG